MLNVQRLVLHGDRLFHGNHVHPDTAAARRQQVGHARQRDIGHPLKEITDLRMLAQTLVALRALFHIEQLCAAGDEHGQDVPPLGGRRGAAVVVVVVAVVVFQQADVAHLVQQLLKMRLVLFLDLVHFPELLDGVGRAQLHGQGDIRHLIGDDGGKAPVFRVVGGEALELVIHNVRDLLAQLQNFLAGGRVALKGRMKSPVFQFLVYHCIDSSFSFQF